LAVFGVGEQEVVALWHGLPARGPVLVRLHSECLTGDVLGSARCDCGTQLEASLVRLARARSGLLLYLHQEGRGIGLVNKIRAYALQDRGLDTVDANRALGLPVDARNYGAAAAVLHHFGIERIRLLTNNPAKRRAMREYGIDVVERVPLQMPPNPVNLSYLRTKRDRMGHRLRLRQ
jgi:GTP cyclohydrolase II